MGEAYQIKDQSSVYFLTFQVVGWVDIFTRKDYRDIIIESFKHCRESKGMKLYSYVIMSNHVHVIMKSKNNDLSGLVRDIKKHTSKEIFNAIKENNKESRKEWMRMIFKYHAKFNKRVREYQLWTHENHAVELNTKKMIESRKKYIHDNPVRAGWVLNQEDYLYSSARNYAELENLLEIDFI